MSIQPPSQTNPHVSTTLNRSLFFAFLMFIVIFLSIVANLVTSNVVYADNGLWTSIGTINTNPTMALFHSGSNLYAGGAFTTIGGVSASRIAKWNGTVWTALGSGVNGNVRTIAINGSSTYVGGDFTTAGGVTVNRVAKWDGSTWTAMNGNGADNTVYALLYQPSTNTLWGGGSFVRGGSTTVNGIAQISTMTWASVGGVSGGTATVYTLALAPNGTTIYVGGNFTSAGGNSTKDIAKWNGSNLKATGGTGMNNTIYTIKVDSNSNVYAGGAFTTAGGSAIPYIAMWNGSTWSALGTGVNGTVYSIFIDSSNNVYVGGAFTTAGGLTVNHVAMWDGTNWHSLGSGMTNTVEALTIDGSNIPYIGGVNTTISSYAPVAPPVPSISQNPSTPTNQSVTVTLNATGGASPTVKYNIDHGTELGPYSIPKQFSMSANGTVYYEFDDQAGNVVTGSYSVTNIDTIPPVVTASKSPSADWANTDVTVTATATDNGGSGVAHVYCMLASQGAWTDGGASTCQQTASTTDTFQYYAVDGAGNQDGTSSSPHSLAINIDKILPSPGKNFTTTPPQGTWTNGTVTAYITAGDDTGGSGTKGVMCDVSPFTPSGSPTVQTCQKTFTSNGILYYASLDNAGNWSPVGSSQITNIDTIPPAVSANKSPSADWANTDVTATANATDNGGSGVTHVYCKLARQGSWTDSVTSTCQQTASTSDTFQYYAVDGAGNQDGTSSSPHTLAINIDKILPSPGKDFTTTPLQGTWTNGTVTAYITAGDDTGGSGTKGINCSTTPTVPITDTTALTCSQTYNANGTLYYATEDNAGNWSAVGSSQITNIDTIAPYAGSVSINPSSWTKGPVTVTVTKGADSGGSGTNQVYCKKDIDSSYTTGNGSTCQLTINPEDASYDVEFYSTDVAGNSSPVVNYIVTNIDITPPSAYTNAYLTLYGENTQFTAIVGNDGAGSGAKGIACSATPGGEPTGDTTDQTCSQSFSTSINPKILYVKTEDNVGNWSTEGVINADNLFNQSSTPVITITKNPNRSVTNSSVTFTATASDPDGVASIWCSLGNNAATNGGSTSCSQTASSSTTFYAYAVDNLGNSGILHPTTSSVTIDQDIPSITSATPQNGFTPGWTDSSGPITFTWQQVSAVSSYKIFISIVGSSKDYEIPVTCTTGSCTYTTPSSMSFTYFDSGFWQIASIVNNVEHWSDRISFYPNKNQ